MSRPLAANMMVQKKKSIDLSNKSFFNNIKAELNSIRTDVNKLVTNKDPSTLPTSSSSSKWSGLSKNISLNDSASGTLPLKNKNSNSS